MLRMQYHSPVEICASSVQVHPQSRAMFIDHLTISQSVVSNDRALLEYLAGSSIHQILLPSQQLCTPSMLAPSPSATGYRTTDKQIERTNEIFMQMRDTSPMRRPVAPKDAKKTPIASLATTSILDPKVYSWLVELFGDDPASFEDVLLPFERELVTFDSLEFLEEEDLKEMDIPVGLRKELLQALALQSNYN